MKAQEAAEVIDAITNSIKANPNQFNFNVSVNISGVSASSHGGGIGAIGIGGNGGPGIYGSASMANFDTKIINNRTNEKLNEEINNLIIKLTAISKELKNSSLNKSKIYEIYESIKNTWVPGIITSVLGNLLSAVIGISQINS